MPLAVEEDFLIKQQNMRLNCCLTPFRKSPTKKSRQISSAHVDNKKVKKESQVRQISGQSLDEFWARRR